MRLPAKKGRFSVKHFLCRDTAKLKKPRYIMKKKKSITKQLCRAGIITALYVGVTYVFMPFAFGPFQVRPAEALCILPLVFPEAVPALIIGCALANITSPYAIFDVVFGSLATFLAAMGTFAVGKWVKKDWLKIVLGGLFPVVLNALIVPFLIVFLYGAVGAFVSTTLAYFSYVGTIAVTEAASIYILGTPLYKVVSRLQKKGYLTR